MKKIKIETLENVLCILCGRIFISTSQKNYVCNYVCNECKTVLKQLSKEYENHETKH